MFDKKRWDFLWRNGDGNGKDDGTDPRTARAGNAGPAENHPPDHAEHHKISAGTGDRSGGGLFWCVPHGAAKTECFGLCNGGDVAFTCAGLDRDGIILLVNRKMIYPISGL